MRFIGALVLLVTIVGFPVAAEADCGGPRITFAPESVDPGDTLTITGESFWDECIDTFPAQEVAEPIEDIELMLVQGDSSWVVARGSADENAEFAVEVVVPADAQAGEARLTASARAWGSTRSVGVLTISNEPAPDEPETAVAAFGPNQDPTATSAAAHPTTNPAPTPSERPTATSGAGDGPGVLTIAAVIAPVAAAVALGTWMIRRRARPT